ncbi:MAG: hypothetical protein JOZ69_25140 [Myxococcales bacterium]|nr:hypothetical protein [Myxococcales bacterium]
MPWNTALANADASTNAFQGYPGGALDKVLRWAFEKQGLYQPPGAVPPISSEGAPPAVDVYIDDGRHGEYPFQPVFWETTDIWNRNDPDGGTAHQTPITTIPNFAYVIVRNRGTQPASKVVVRGYHCKPSVGFTWPDDCLIMDTPEITLPGTLAPGANVTVGPFQWVPSEVGHECLFFAASATGDPSNIDPSSALPCAIGPTPIERLVPFDNNLGQRNVAPVAGGDSDAFSASFRGRHFFVKNPLLRAADVRIEAVLPAFLRERGWQVRFVSAGGAAFRLGPSETREVFLHADAGRPFTAEDVRRSGGRVAVQVRVRVAGQMIGGMTYLVDPHLTAPPREVPGGGPHRPGHGRRARHDDVAAARSLLERLGITTREEIERVNVRAIDVRIELDPDDEH